MIRLLSLAVVALLAACAARPEPPACPVGLTPGLEARLFFGRNAGDRQVVGEADWQAFVDREVAPRLPGFTVLATEGAWTDERGTAVREAGTLLLVILPEGEAGLPALRAIAEAYKARFAQDSVLTVVQPVCHAF